MASAPDLPRTSLSWGPPWAANSSAELGCQGCPGVCTRFCLPFRLRPAISRFEAEPVLVVTVQSMVCGQAGGDRTALRLGHGPRGRGLVCVPSPPLGWECLGARRSDLVAPVSQEPWSLLSPLSLAWHEEMGVAGKAFQRPWVSASSTAFGGPTPWQSWGDPLSVLAVPQGHVPGARGHGTGLESLPAPVQDSRRRGPCRTAALCQRPLPCPLCRRSTLAPTLGRHPRSSQTRRGTSPLCCLSFSPVLKSSCSPGSGLTGQLSGTYQCVRGHWGVRGLRFIFSIL